MAKLLLVDDAAALAHMFGEAITTALGHEVYSVANLSDIDETIDGEDAWLVAVP